MSIAQALTDSAFTEVRTEADGVCLYWRIRRYNSADLVAQGIAALAAVPQEMLLRMARAQQADSPEERERLAAEVLQHHGGRAAKLAAQARQLEDAAICAAVRGVSQDGSEWEDLALVLVPHRADPDEGRVLVADLPGPIRAQLAQAVQAHQGDGGALAERLASFRGEPGAAADAGPGGKAVRSDAA